MTAIQTACACWWERANVRFAELPLGYEKQLPNKENYVPRFRLHPQAVTGLS